MNKARLYAIRGKFFCSSFMKYNLDAPIYSTGSFVIYPCLKDCTFPIITKEITVGLLLDKCTK